MLSPVGERARLWAYGLTLALAGGLVIFPGLGQSALMTDEGMYIQIVENMRSSGDWSKLVLYGQPYFNKPPLYFWIAALTADWLPPGEAGIRFWSAVFGWATVLLTAWLAARFQRPEAGLMAGALLLGNAAYLDKHGCRDGCFDTGITMMALVSYLIYGSQARRHAWGWLLIGLACAAICLFKPIYGLPLLGLLGLHFLLTERAMPWTRRLFLPALALLVCLAAASPWYLLQFHEHGFRYLHHVFGHEIAQRATTGLFQSHVQGRFFYPLAIAASSALFPLAWPALAWCGWLAWRQPRSWLAGFILWMTIGWVAMCSLSSSKLIRYVYVVFPLLCVAIAILVESLLALCWDRLQGWRAAPPPRWQPVPLAGAGVGLLFLAAAIQAGLAIQAAPPRDYPPWQVYQRLQPEIERDEVRFIAFRYLGGAHGEGYYISQMRRLLQLDDAAELERQLGRGPAILLVHDLTAVRLPGIGSLSLHLQDPPCIPMQRTCFLVWTWPAGTHLDLPRWVGPYLSWTGGSSTGP